jgi:hypothetical protein
MFDLMFGPGLMPAFFRIGAISLVFGLREAVGLAFGYYLLMWLMRREDDYD